MRVALGESWRLSGRTFSAEELEWIKGLLGAELLTRRQLARRVCEQLNWINRAGRLKEMSCRVALLRMDRAGLIHLAAPRHPGSPTPMAESVSRSGGLRGRRGLCYWPLGNWGRSAGRRCHPIQLPLRVH